MSTYSKHGFLKQLIDSRLEKGELGVIGLFFEATRSIFTQVECYFCIKSAKSTRLT